MVGEKNILLSFIIVIILSSCIKVSSKELDWTEREKRWRLSLTYPDYRENDFGRSVPEGDRPLLERFKPRVIISPNGLPPIDFYEYYLPNSVVRDSYKGDMIIKEVPDREYLKRIERDKRYYLDYTGGLSPCPNGCDEYIGVGYGRIYREEVSLRKGDDEKERTPMLFLKYNFVFTTSGLPAELSWYKELLATIGGDPDNWHELDIHGAVHIALTYDKRPIALILAQHNHYHTYLIAKDILWPSDNHVSICFAERSNEPYPCHNEREPKLYRTISNPGYIRYLIDGRDPPFTSGMDKVYGIASGGKEISYTLKFLPDHDPLYVSWIPLGDRQKIFYFFDTFYRKGPPGMDMNTWPELKRYGDIMQFWYFRNNNEEDARIMEEGIKSFSDVDFEAILEHNGKRFYRDMKTYNVH